MSIHHINIKRGLDLQLNGAVSAQAPLCAMKVQKVAICPDDFPGFTPRLICKEGDTVVQGSPLLADKIYPDVCLCSPVEGRVAAVVRGERRRILRVEIEVSTDAPTSSSDLCNVGADADLAKVLQRTGLWAMMRQRPYDIVPRPGVTPDNIFITAVDSAPLEISEIEHAPFTIPDIEAATKALASLTPGKVYLATRPEVELPPLPDSLEHVKVSGPHPAGNAGVIASIIAPVNKGQVIWTLDFATFVRIGKRLLANTPQWLTTVAVTGPMVKEPFLAQVPIGASIRDILHGHYSTEGAGEHVRVISGNVLTGTKVELDGYLRYPYRQLTLIAEGDDRDEFMGWASMSPAKHSATRTFLSWLMPHRRYSPDARINGGRRAMIVSGAYEKVMPIDILPEHLVKAIIACDIDAMERLGIYEVAPEDFALCEYVDPSKLELQKIVRQGLDYLRKEVE